MFKFSQSSINKLEGVHPDLQRLCYEALKSSPIDFGIIQGVRTQEYQDGLYEQGRSTPGPVVTWTRNSKHIKQADGWGHAIDFAVYLGGKINWEPGFYKQIVDVFKSKAKELDINIVCGADWKTKDWGHVELVD